MPMIDYLILTPLNEEFRYLREAWPVPLVEEKVGKIHFYRALHQYGAHEATVVVAAMMNMGQAWSGVFASEALRIWNPANVVHIGIAGTLDKDVSLGDVIIPGEVIGYEIGDAVDAPAGTEFKFRSTGGQTDFALLGSAHALQDNPEEYAAWQDDAYLTNEHTVLGSGRNSRPSAHIGAQQILASGNFVVKSAAFGEKLRATLNHRITAVEMEAKGLFNAITLATNRPATLILRGISDRADQDKVITDEATKGAFRAGSVRSAARYMAAVIDRRLRLGQADEAAQPLVFNLVRSRKSPIVAGSLGLRSSGNNTLCVAFESLMSRPAGAPRLDLELVLTGQFPPTSDVGFALRQSWGEWTRVFQSSGKSEWKCVIDRSFKPYSLTLAVVANTRPNGTLKIRARDEFGRTVEDELDFAGRNT